MRSPTPRGLVAARPGRLPAHHTTGQRPVVLRRPFGLPRVPRQPLGIGVSAAERQRQRPARPGGGACGPSRAALTRAAMIYQHTARERDEHIADALSSQIKQSRGSGT
ncbi:hypothetical protein GCM10010169_09720 [Micromonospora fulviviridis]|nr:hypothetical protein GCM10010169_09720 [Micromonospora fulviviridis]